MTIVVTVFTTSPEKTHDAKRFGATHVVVNRDGADFSAFKHAFDFALDTVPHRHDLNRFIPLLKRDATYCRVGVGKIVDTIDVGQMSLVLYRNAIAGSNTGGIRETQDMVDFCALNNIRPEIEKIPMTGIDEAWSKVVEKASGSTPSVRERSRHRWSRTCSPRGSWISPRRSRTSCLRRRA